jgi:hypothetical protein
MSTLVEIEHAIERLPDWDVDQLVAWLEVRRVKKTAHLSLIHDPDFLMRARQVWGERPSGAKLSELVSSNRD